MVHKMRAIERNFDFVSDPAHGWVKVPVSLLRELGIAGKITSYSYRKGKNAYLEEDVDATLFVNAFKKRFGVNPKFNERVVDRTPIRSYPSYS